MGDKFSECAANVIDTVRILDHLNFVSHPQKSVFNPTQILVRLGFILNYKNMTVYFTTEKLKRAVARLLSCNRPLIRKCLN